MADYVMLEDIFETTEYMETLRNESLNDDGTDTVAGVDWFKFKENTADSFYVSGNSWIGMGQIAEQLKICRRDADLLTLRREEGTLFAYYKFLRIRWEGYSVHGNRTAATRLVWDALFFDTGDIVLYFTEVPTSASYIGECVLYTKSKNISFSIEKGKALSFLHKDGVGNEYELSSGMPVFLDPYNRRYLFKDVEGVFYTIVDELLTPLEETQLTAELFETYGLSELPDGNLLTGLKNPTVLYWHDSDNLFPDMKLSYSGIPKPQVIYSENIDMSHYSILGIEKVICDCDENCLFAVSFDDGETWLGYVNGSWVKFTEETSGMSKAAIEAISSDTWAEKATTGMIKYRFVLSGADGYITSVITDFLNTEE